MRTLAPQVGLHVVALLVGCSSPAPGVGAPSSPAPSASPAPPPVVSGTGTGESPALPPPAAAEALAGRWTSPSCGDRRHERALQLDPEGTFTSWDLVSPCPPGRACVWSGIVTRKGRFTIAGERLVLTPDDAAGGPKIAPLPPSLDLVRGAPVEVAGAERCPYARP